jgi:hypothetical protein
MNTYKVVNQETGNTLFQYGGGNHSFATAVEMARDSANKIHSPMAVMSHFCDASDDMRYKSELYIAQPRN